MYYLIKLVELYSCFSSPALDSLHTLLSFHFILILSHLLLKYLYIIYSVWGMIYEWLPQNFCAILALSIRYEIENRFEISMCLNDCLKLPNNVRSFAKGTNTSLVVKNRIKIIMVERIRLLPVYRFWSFKFLNNLCFISIQIGVKMNRFLFG